LFKVALTLVQLARCGIKQTTRNQPPNFWSWRAHAQNSPMDVMASRNKSCSERSFLTFESGCETMRFLSFKAGVVFLNLSGSNTDCCWSPGGSITCTVSMKTENGQNARYENLLLII
jgi:hypothetical protein